MSSTVLLLFLSAHLAMGNSNFWSKTGHRVIGDVAQEHLNGKTKRAISKLLNGQSLAAVSNYADIIKSDRAFKNFSAWHYVNIPLDKNYSEVEPNPNSELVNEIYTSVKKGEKLGYTYSYKYWNTVEKQLQKGGLRLARVLNDIYC